MSQPFYHLRPNKNIDRKLFIQTLVGLSRQYPIHEYHYTGFGSYLFDDFKLLHDTFGITHMTSLENDLLEYQRAIYNCPYNCIEIKQTSSTEYLSELEISDDEKNIFWLDFVSPRDLGQQLADYATLLNLVNSGDIIRITLNANPDSLGKADHPDDLPNIRIASLRDRVPEKYFPPSLSQDCVTRKNYPLTLLKIVRAITTDVLKDKPPYSPEFLLPLFSSVYSDGQQMLTFTGLVLDSHEQEKTIKNALKNYQHNNFLWDNPANIQIPALSVKEILEINKLLPDDNIRQQLADNFSFIFQKSDPRAIESYISYYKYYPNYHQVSF